MISQIVGIIVGSIILVSGNLSAYSREKPRDWNKFREEFRDWDWNQFVEEMERETRDWNQFMYDTGYKDASHGEPPYHVWKDDKYYMKGYLAFFG